jgi:hypothetical protein
MLTIISPAAHQRLTTVEALRVELGLTGGADDAYLEALIEQASAAMASWCGRSFALESVRETLHRDGRAGTLMLSRWPVVSIEAVTIGGTVLDPALAEAEDGGFLYQLDGNGCRIGWPSGRAVVDYRAGYVLPDKPASTLPKDIERAAIIQVKAWFLGRDRDPLTRSENVEGVGSTDYFSGTRTDLVPEVENILSRYRTVMIG